MASIPSFLDAGGAIFRGYNVRMPYLQEFNESDLILPELSGPTRTKETEERYIKRARSLIAKCARETMGPNARGDDVEPMQLVSWLVDSRKNLAKSSWRQYKSSAMYWLRSVLGTQDALKAADFLEDKNSSVCIKKTMRTSGRRLKSYDAKVFYDFLTAIDGVAETSPYRRYTGILKTWLMLGTLTGLRPHEWCGARVFTVGDRDVGRTESGPSASLATKDTALFDSLMDDDVELGDPIFADMTYEGTAPVELPSPEVDEAAVFDLDAYLAETVHLEHDADDLDDDAQGDLDLLANDTRTDTADEHPWVESDAPIEYRDALVDGVKMSLNSGHTYLRVKNSKHTNGRAHGEYRHLDLTEFNAVILTAVNAFVRFMSPLSRSRYTATYDACRHLLAEINASFFGEDGRHIQLYSPRHFYASNAKRALHPTQVAAAMGHANDHTAYSMYGNAKYASGGRMAKPVDEEALKVRQVRKTPEFLEGSRAETGLKTNNGKDSGTDSKNEDPND